MTLLQLETNEHVRYCCFGEMRADLDHAISMLQASQIGAATWSSDFLNYPMIRSAAWREVSTRRPAWKSKPEGQP